MRKNCQFNEKIALAWCLAWGDSREPNLSMTILQQMRSAIAENTEVPAATIEIIEQVSQLLNLEFPENLLSLRDTYPGLWNQQTPIGLVYGGATKIKGYVFESANLQEIRGASAILDRINLIDLPAFFCQEKSSEVSQWLDREFPGLKEALIPELIIYSTGGNILAFCPAAFIDDLANAIEKRYTEETLTANSCAVGEKFRLLEMRLGLLGNPIENTRWLDWYLDNYQSPLVQAYFGRLDKEIKIQENFENRKSFNELAGKLASKFQHRRNGNDVPHSSRPSKRYPPMFETHPYLVRDENQQRSAIARAEKLPGEPWFSDAVARKYIVGQRVKREGTQGQAWWTENLDFRWEVDNQFTQWNAGEQESWVWQFTKFLKESGTENSYYKGHSSIAVQEAIRTEEISNGSDGFMAFIYADGNNMGGYIQKIKTPQEYARFSQDIFEATKISVFRALEKHLSPHQLKNLTNSESQHRNRRWIHPFEIIAIGGDDVLLIVPANKALQISQTIGEEFEKILCTKSTYRLESTEADKSVNCHRYSGTTATPSQCKLSMSIGVLITSYKTPIYYAENLTNQLLKSAKKKAKELKSSEYKYHGGTVDFFALKSVTMISSNIQAFREEALIKTGENRPKLKLYGSPYTLHELGGLLKTVEALKKSEFPRSQLYQIRSLLERGKKTAILNYLYFRTRLKPKQKQLLQQDFEESWCKAKTNDGNLAPWMYDPENKIYETIWREMVDLYPFIDVESSEISQGSDRE